MAAVAKLGTVSAISTSPSTRLLTPKEASEFLSVPEKTLAQWRSQRRGPLFVRMENRLIRYRSADLQSYVNERIVEPLD
jgi:predicted DNA-binding transcriptional regulator AlpA